MLLLAGCDATGEKASTGPFSFEATVQFVQVEGGVWVLESDDGTTYRPTNLPSAFQEEGLRVSGRADQLENAADIYMVGPIVRILDIRRE
ncbi:hypothetical protein [Salisaeta longa]|uniref:hypothetical protein n=1 Tax=Salisaeta longa TaxID=503170 RepID=UPI0003B4B6B4|nr:hypothetical protein [Salisaeta longa]